MIDPALQKSLYEEIGRLDSQRQEQVLAYARALARQTPPGAAGSTYLQFVGAIDRSDLDRMQAAIHEGCEQVNPDEW